MTLRTGETNSSVSMELPAGALGENRRTPEKTLGKGRAQREIIPKNTLQPKVFRSR